MSHLPIYSPHEFYQKLQELFLQGTPLVTIILVDTRGSAPQEQGARMIVTQTTEQEKPFWGTVGGGKVEYKAILHAKALMHNTQGKTKDFVTWNLQKDVGMTCGGEVKFFFEVHSVNSWDIVIFGAGHVAQALIPILLTLNCHVTCIDTRQEWLEKLPLSPFLKTLQADDLPSLVKNLPEKSFILSMTKGHATDLPILKEVLKMRTPPYLGVIGSQSKSLILRRELAKEELTQEKLNSFFCPIGLPLGRNSPNEMAISIAAQLLQERDRIFPKKFPQHPL